MIPSTGARRSRHDIAPAIEQRTRVRIERAVFRARLVLYWEALWPRLVPLVVLIGIFVTLSWLGVWRITPDWVRFVTLGLFGAGTLFLILRALRTRIPDRTTAFARVEKSSGGAHRPATAYSDRLVSASDDPASQTLWKAHRRRLLAALAQLKAGTPDPRLPKHDPYAFRFLAALLVIVAFFYAGPERVERLNEALHGGEPIAATLARIDAWVTPPAYTSRAPLFLTGETIREPGTTYSVPQGSVVTVRIGGNRDLSVVGTNSAGELPVERTDILASNTNGGARTPLEHHLTLTDETSVVVRRGDRDVTSWQFAIVPDAPPTIVLLKPPEPTVGGSLAVTYAIEDDYGVIAAEAMFAPLGTIAAGAEMRPLIPPPDFPLSLPQLRARSGNSITIRDLTSHPWAGARVLLTMVARDDLGQEGMSAPTEVTMPSRHFSNPLARAIVEQRTKLALDANAADRVADGLDALTFAGEDAIEDIGTYLALRSAYHRLIEAHDDDELRGIVDYLWAIARGVEDGALSLTAQALRDAQEALRQALEDDASDDEIARLTEELREALHSYLQALAEEARRNPQLGMLSPDTEVQSFRSEDFDRMLDRIEELARNGARDSANQLLSELQSILDQLQADQQMMINPQVAEMLQQLDQLGEMIRRQQQLMDETHLADRGLNPDNPQSPGMSDDELDQALERLQRQQSDLQQSLEDLLAQLDSLGMEPNLKLDQAGEAMEDATDALGEGSAGRAVGDQGDALDALRQGAESLAEQLANLQPGQSPGGIYGGGTFPNEDPLGRMQQRTGPTFGSQVEVPDEIDTQRAREILEAIRRRLSEPTRPIIEREYLERLLDRF